MLFNPEANKLRASPSSLITKTVGTVVTKFFYNLEDRLERIEDGAGTVIASYYYDPFGRRLWKDVGGVRTHFHYSDEGLVGEYDAAGTVVQTYGYKPGSTWATDPLFMKVGSDYYFYHTDHLGTPQKMTSGSGAVVWSATYSSFGEATVDGTSTVVNNLRFPGQYFDRESGLHYNRYRYYDAKIGRYFRLDPIGLMGGVNLFSYVLNNSINSLDPLGLSKRKWDQFTNDPRVKPIIGKLNHEEIANLYEQWEKERRCKHGGCANPYMENDFPGEEILKFIGDTKVECKWDKIADCVNDKCASTSPETAAWCLKYAVSRGRDREAGTNCFSESVIGVMECYKKYCDVSNCNID